MYDHHGDDDARVDDDDGGDDDAHVDVDDDDVDGCDGDVDDRDRYVGDDYCLADNDLISMIIMMNDIYFMALIMLVKNMCRYIISYHIILLQLIL
jgi:hypothetical protein